MLARLVTVSALAVAALAASGCGQSVAVATWVPPEADIGGARRLVITDSYGRDSSVAAITDFAVAQGRAAPWFDSVERSFDRLETDGDDAWLGGRGAALEGGALYVRLDVLEDSAVVDHDEASGVDEHGNDVVVVSEHLLAHTLVSMTVADRRGVVVFEREVEGVHEQSDGPISDFDIADAQDQAGRAAVAGALALITPVSLTVQLPLDEHDPEALDVARRGLDGDRDDARAAIAALDAIDSAAAVYNAGVLSEDNGDVEAAVDFYADACARADAADFCDEVKAGAEVRLANERALGLR